MKIFWVIHLEKIAKEKAGIIKENIPTLLGPEIKEYKVFETTCKEKKITITCC